MADELHLSRPSQSTNQRSDRGMKRGEYELDVDDTTFKHYLGKSPEIKVLDFLIENRRDSWNITEMEQQGNIARATLKLVIPKFLKLGLIQVDRIVGNSKLYKINLDNPIVKRIMKLYQDIDEIESERFIKNEVIVTSS